MLVLDRWGDPFYLKFWIKLTALERNRRFSISYRSYSGSAVTTNEKVVPKPPKRAQKRKMDVFPLKLHFAWRKSATKFLCVKTVSDKVVGHSLA